MTRGIVVAYVAGAVGSGLMFSVYAQISGRSDVMYGELLGFLMTLTIVLTSAFVSSVLFAFTSYALAPTGSKLFACGIGLASPITVMVLSSLIAEELVTSTLVVGFYFSFFVGAFSSLICKLSSLLAVDS